METKWKTQTERMSDTHFCCTTRPGAHELHTELSILVPEEHRVESGVQERCAKGTEMRAACRGAQK